MIEIYIDVESEVVDLLEHVVDGVFWDFNAEPIRPGAVYVLGRLEMARCLDKARAVAESGQAHIVFSNPAEGSSTMDSQIEVLKIQDLVRAKKISVLSGSVLGSEYLHFYFDSFAHRVAEFETNQKAMLRCDEIYSNTNKPYTFLFLNGRMRTHRKWMLAQLRIQGLLDNSLYSCLHSRNARNADLTLMHNGQDLMQLIEPLHYLPAKYEVDRYADRIGLPPSDPNVKYQLFDNEWGEAYIKPDPYIDTYFSLVTETVFDTPHSFRTEKIWKPIMMGHPWIAVTNAGFYRDLHNLGFKTFDSIIDEDFDQIQDPQKRLERITSIVKDLCQGNLKDFLSQAQGICKYNQQHLLQYVQQQAWTFPTRFVEFLTETLDH
jgi:hypothetical protein